MTVRLITLMIIGAVLFALLGAMIGFVFGDHQLMGVTYPREGLVSYPIPFAILGAIAVMLLGFSNRTVNLLWPLFGVTLGSVLGGLVCVIYGLAMCFFCDEAINAIPYFMIGGGLIGGVIAGWAKMG